MVFIIDCRFKYEYEGGHVNTAINIPNGDSTRTELWERFFKAPFLNKKVAIIFYCEFSSKRGPRGYAALFIRLILTGIKLFEVSIEKQTRTDIHIYSTQKSIYWMEDTRTFSVTAR